MWKRQLMYRIEGESNRVGAHQGIHHKWTICARSIEVLFSVTCSLIWMGWVSEWVSEVNGKLYKKVVRLRCAQLLAELIEQYPSNEYHNAIFSLLATDGYSICIKREFIGRPTHTHSTHHLDGAEWNYSEWMAQSKIWKKAFYCSVMGWCWNFIPNIS